MINQLEIAGKTTIISEINDLTISTQVKAFILRDLGRDIYQRTLITTENSVVYVMGFVSKTEAAALENVVSSVRALNGSYEYLNISTSHLASRCAIQAARVWAARGHLRPPL